MPVGPLQRPSPFAVRVGSPSGKRRSPSLLITVSRRYRLQLLRGAPQIQL